MSRFAKTCPPDKSATSLGFEAKFWLASDKHRSDMGATGDKYVALGKAFLKNLSGFPLEPLRTGRDCIAVPDIRQINGAALRELQLGTSLTKHRTEDVFSEIEARGHGQLLPLSGDPFHKFNDGWGLASNMNIQVDQRLSRRHEADDDTEDACSFHSTL